MCHAGSSPPAPPSSGPAASAPAASSVVACPLSASSIQLIDELGLPLAGVSVRVTVGAATATTITDANGLVCFSAPPGTSVTVELDEMHEGSAGESTTTPSGTHFRAGGTGP